MKKEQKQTGKADILDVARTAKVSASTVSRSFNHPDLVNPATRRKIDRAVKKLGYIRNRAAQTMHGKRSATIGLVVPTINHAIFAEVIQSFSDAVDEAGFTLLIASHGYDLDREYAVLRKLLEHRVDGIALIGLDHTEESFQLLEQQGIPSVAMWNFAEQSRLSCVGCENFTAGQMAAGHLVELGHRDIALVFPQTHGNDRARDRWSGALSALAEAGLDPAQSRRSEVPYSIALAKEAALSLLSAPNAPTALLCGNDVIAQGAIYAARKLGLDVPGDVSIVGIGDFKGSEELEPALTTVRIPAQNIGEIAGKHLSRAIASEEQEIRRYRCDLDMKIRASTGPGSMLQV